MNIFNDKWAMSDEKQKPIGPRCSRSWLSDAATTQPAESSICYERNYRVQKAKEKSEDFHVEEPLIPPFLILWPRCTDLVTSGRSCLKRALLSFTVFFLFFFLLLSASMH